MTFTIKSLLKEDTVFDCIFLLFITTLSSIFYIQNIGFYGDDWSFLANLNMASDKSLFGLYTALNNPNTFMRPIQNLLDAGLYFLFRLDPLGYHISNFVILQLNAILLYLLLKKLNIIRIFAITITLIYILLPNYSTDRFWFAAFQANISISFYLYGFLATIKYLNSPKKAYSIIWLTISLFSLILSTLAYEVILPLYIFNILLIAFYNSKKKLNKLLFNLKQKLIITSTLLALATIAIFKTFATTRLDNGPLEELNHYPGYLYYIVTSSIWSNYVHLIFNLIRIWGDFHNGDLTGFMIISSLLIGLSVFVYLFIILKNDLVNFPSQIWLRNITLIGFIIFGLGYFIFLFNNNVGFSPTGMDNRVAIGAALGVAISLAGIFGLLIQYLFPKKTSKIIFPIIIAIICTSNSLLIYKISSYWKKSYIQEQSILKSIKKKYPTLPQNSTLILDGICPYIGPAVVFDAKWDLKGAIQLLYSDKTLQADIVTKK